MRYIITFSFILFLYNCAISQSWEHGSGGTVDTINKMDHYSYKQGKWVIKGKHRLKPEHSQFHPEQTIETGMYVNNRKEGIWMEYYTNGKERSKLTYVNGALEGEATFFNTNGCVLKSGKFHANKWVN